MPEQRISQIQVRVGDLQDLPILATGEFGYAEYENRLFIGNPPVAVGTGNGTDVTFNVPALSSFLVPASSVEKIVFYVDGTERNDITLNPTTVTFATAPSNQSAITMTWNTEIPILGSIINPTEILLDATMTPTPTGLRFDGSVYFALFMDYTMQSMNDDGLQIGKLRFLIDAVNEEFRVDNQFNEIPDNVDLDVNFSIEFNNGFFEIVYTNGYSHPIKFKYDIKLWKK